MYFISAVPVPSVGPVTLFPTEDGASPTKLSVQHQSSLPTFHPATSGGTKKKRSKSLLEGGLNYHTIPPFAMPKNNVAGKWRWAIKKVLQNIRRKKLKIGFTRTRVEKKQTIAERLDQIDRDLFVIPQELAKNFQQKLSTLSDELNQTITGVKGDLTNYATQTDAHLVETDAKINDIAEKINSHDERITKMIDALAQKEAEDIRVVTEQIAILRKQLRDEVQVELTRLTTTLQDLTREFTELDHQAKALMRDIKNTTILSENPPEDKGVDLLTQLLDKDKSTRHQAHRMSIIEGHADVLHRLLLETKEGVAAMYDRYLKRIDAGTVQYPLLNSEDMESLQELNAKATVSEGMTKSVKDSLSIMYGMLQRHDELLRDTAQTVLCESVQMMDLLPGLQTQLSAAISNNLALQESLKTLTSEKNQLKDQMAAVQHEQKGSKEKVARMERIIEAQDLSQVTGEMNKMRDQMDGFKGMIGGMQAQMMTLFQTVMLQAQMGQMGQMPAMISPQHGAKSLRNSVSQAPLRASLMVPPGAAPPIPREVDGAPAAIAVPGVTAEASITTAGGEDETGASPSVAPGGTLEDGGSFVEVPGDGGGAVAEGDEVSVAPPGDAMAMMHQMMSMMLPSGNTSTTNMVAPSIVQGMGGSSSVAGGMGMGMGLMGGFGLGGGVTEERVEEIVRNMLEGVDFASPQPSPAPQSANGKKTRQVSIGGVSTVSEDASPTTPKAKRQATGLMGSFADYNARKSLARLPSSPAMLGGGGGGGAHHHHVGEHGFDPAPLLADIANIRAEAMALQKQLEALTEEKTTKPEVEKVCLEIIREYRKREARTDYRTMLEDMDVSLRELVHELIGVKKDQERIEHDLRKTFEDGLASAISETKKEMIDASKESVLSTKGLCLGCGRSSMVKMESTSRPLSPSFLPALNANIQPGPEIFRGGFRLPGRSLSPPTSYPEIPILMRNRVQTAPAQAAEAAYHSRRSYFSQSTDAAFAQQQQAQQQEDALAPSVTLLQSPGNSAPHRHSSQGLRVGFADDEPDSILMQSQSQLPPLQSQSASQPQSLRVSFAEGSETLTVTMPAIPLSQLNPGDDNLDFVASLDTAGPATAATNSSGGAASQQPPSSAGGTGRSYASGRVKEVPSIGSGGGGGSIVRPNVSASDAETLRPLYRKGFPAKKSMKAEMTYAPERFDLGVRSLGGSSLTSATQVGGGLGVLSTSHSSSAAKEAPRPSTVSSLLNAAGLQTKTPAQSRSTVSFA